MAEFLSGTSDLKKTELKKLNFKILLMRVD